MEKTVALIIMDGWGIGAKNDTNAIYRAQTPTIDHFKKFYPSTSLQSAGIAVGLPWGEAGNSEVGHLTIGAGRTLYQHLPRISLAIKNESFFINPALKGAYDHAKKTGGKVHILSLLTDGNVHASFEHLRALLKMASLNKEVETFFHLFTDGKDSPVQSGKSFCKNLVAEMEYLKTGRLASLSGRYFALDRRKNWNLTQKIYNMLVKGEAHFETSWEKVFDEHYESNGADPYVRPTLLADKEDSNNWPVIKSGDAMFFADFREDSMRQVTSPFCLPGFSEFETVPLEDLYVATITEYDDDFTAKVAFPPEYMKNGLSETISLQKGKQLKIAETEKFFHLTYFFNGLTDKVFENEFRILIPSKEMAHLDQAPEMRAKEITDRLVAAMESKAYDLIVVNYANTDSMAHTGNFEATVKAVEIVDQQLARVHEVAKRNNISLIISSDHGNAEQVYNPKTGAIETEHNPNPVPFYLVDEDYKYSIPKTEKEIIISEGRTNGVVSDIAPTILELMKLKKPIEMKGKSLLKYI